MAGLLHHGLESVCGVLDIEAFQHGQILFYREIAYAPVKPVDNFTGNVLQHSVNPPFIPSRRNRELWKTFNRLKHKITGLDLIPQSDESVVSQPAVQWILLGWYEATRTTKRFVVAYKGGQLEKDLLHTLQIPSLNLETFGCPALEKLSPEMIISYNDLDCGQHRFHTSGHLHCPMKKTVFFIDWLLCKLQSEREDVRSREIELMRAMGHDEVSVCVCLKKTKINSTKIIQVDDHHRHKMNSEKSKVSIGLRSAC